MKGIVGIMGERLHCVVDPAVYGAEEALAPLGTVQRFAPGGLPSTELSKAEALIVRSVDRIDRALLERAPLLRFVGSATAGVDHVDLHALADADIAFAHAPGCNARAVVEWVFAATAMVRPDVLSGGSVFGVIGCGAVGSRLARLAASVGHSVLRNDPPRQQAGDPGPWASRSEVLARADVISVHVPLTRSGPNATEGLIARPMLAAVLRRGATIVNTSRGPVFEPGDLRTLPAGGGLILDVWPDEPRLPWAALAKPSRVDVASPHVAGYSERAKRRATQAMVEALESFVGPSGRDRAPLAIEPTNVTMQEGERVEQLLSRVAGIQDDDAAVRAADGPEAFAGLRRAYAMRPQWCDLRVDGGTNADRVALAGLGVRMFGPSR